jgi:hypothetical protein
MVHQPRVPATTSRPQTACFVRWGRHVISGFVPSSFIRRRSSLLVPQSKTPKRSRNTRSGPAVIGRQVVRSPAPGLFRCATRCSLSGLVIHPKLPKVMVMVGQGSLKKDLFAVPKFGLSPRASPAPLHAGLQPVTTANSGGARLQAIRILTQLDTVLRTFKRQSSQPCREHIQGHDACSAIPALFWSISDQIRSTSASLCLVPSAAKI